MAVVDGVFSTVPGTAALSSPSDRICPSMVSTMMVPPLPTGELEKDCH